MSDEARNQIAESQRQLAELMIRDGVAKVAKDGTVSSVDLDDFAPINCPKDVTFSGHRYRDPTDDKVEVKEWPPRPYKEITDEWAERMNLPKLTDILKIETPPPEITDETTPTPLGSVPDPVGPHGGEDSDTPITIDRE